MDYFVDTNRTFWPSDWKLPLVHMTQSWEVLELILKEGLKPSYCAETLTNNTDYKKACFPMISFSNVSMSDAVQFQCSYGTLGIALSADWGKKNGLNPVLYLERSSDITNEIVNGFGEIATHSIGSLELSLSGGNNSAKGVLTRQMIKVFAHSKNYDGELVRNGKLESECYRFGLEREWRKVIMEKQAPYFLVGDDIQKKKEFNAKIEHLRYDFELQDLEGVIVETEGEKTAALTILAEKFPGCDLEKVEIMINRIRHVPDEG